MESMKVYENVFFAKYCLYRGNVKKDKKDKKENFIVRYPKKKISVKYFYKNEKWNTNDAKQLDKIERFMKIKPRQFIL